MGEECMQGNTKVRYYHHSFEEKAPQQEKPTEEVKLRKNAEKEQSPSKNSLPKNQEPLQWFGVLTPPSLKQAQANFTIATEIALDCANIQSEILGVQNRMKYVQRLIQKAQKENKDEIEDLDSSFSSAMTIM